MNPRFKLCRLPDYYPEQEVFAVVVQGRRTPGIVAHWRGRFSSLKWAAFRGTGFKCKQIKSGLTKKQAIDTVLNLL